MRRFLIVLLIAIALTVGGGGSAVRWTESYVHRPLLLREPLVMTVASGSSFAAVAQDLARRGLIEHPRLWVWYVRLRGLDASIHAGEYRIAPGATPASVLDQLIKGEVLLRELTLVEGTTFRDLLHLLAAQPSIKHTLDQVSAADLMTRLGSAGVHPEGQFFPDTYRFAAGTSDLELLKKAHGEMQRRLETAWQARSHDLPLATPYEALILASIVEKETALPAERARIAGVFVRRLRLGMRLQSDPTVIYGIGEQYQGDIRTRDLRTDTPYNSYTRAGLPPTPIALPGEAALRAATQPDDTGALFFVATGAADGSHHFSATLEEHNAAVRRYLARSRGRNLPAGNGT